MDSSHIDRRSRLRQQRGDSPLLRLPFRQLRNPMKPVEILDEEQIEQLHQAAMQILENTGIAMMDEETLAIWENAGARVDKNNQRVRMDRGLVMEAVVKAPASFTWRARNPKLSNFVGENSITLAPHGGMVYVSDLDNGRRRGTLKEYENLVRLSQACNVIHYNGGELVALNDVDSSIRHLTRLYTDFLLTDKALIEAAHGRVIPLDSFNMAKIVFGDDISSTPVLGGVINVSSPLRYDGRMLGGLLTYARYGQVNIITPFILAGAMSPVTMAAALAQQNAEVLAGIALTQLANPGAPVIYGGFTTNVDMKSGSPAFGTPEGAWALLVGAQLARRYKLPYRGSGGLNSAKTPDAQAAYESLWTMWPAMLAHTNFILHSAGWLEGGMTVSLEKYVIDAEMLAMFYHFMAGFEINDENLALDSIDEVGPGGHHFGTAHTMERFSTAFYQPTLGDNLGYEVWESAGSWDAARRANAVWKEILANYEPPALDAGIQEELEAYVARRTKELAGKNLYE